MPIENFFLPALERVLSWDIPDEVSGAAASAQAELMAGHSPDALGWDGND